MDDPNKPTPDNDHRLLRYGARKRPNSEERARNPSQWRQFDESFPTRFVRSFLMSPPIMPPPGIPDPQPTPQSRPDNQEGFTPMNPWPGQVLDAGPLWVAQLAATGASPHYRGNPYLAANQSANIREELNTALWITNLPPNCTHFMLLNSIRNCGKVYATVINPPEDAIARPRPGTSRTHTTSASKLVFFDREGVNRLMAQSMAGTFTVGGYVPRVLPNRIKSGPREPGPQCRVLHIEGPSDIVNQPSLHRFFQTKFTYELESVATLATYGDVTRQEWRFGSFRCQAESARQSIAREKDRHANLEGARGDLWARVVVHYGVDPCA
ncbi:hypothetical protein F4820DRAFT_464158 [Hypoxylon rubiginosum]|uniref:Uncharacterized protein n=1 Tax=Hypoxylon rubiginosum TaxID=110542 RepID=A0ACB9YS01_9PEZI|nr:hypothetical protein F4820DRAFT_464158 [Hypoxylon rubiginosum]